MKKGVLATILFLILFPPVDGIIPFRVYSCEEIEFTRGVVREEFEAAAVDLIGDIPDTFSGTKEEKRKKRRGFFKKVIVAALNITIHAVVGKSRGESFISEPEQSVDFLCIDGRANVSAILCFLTVVARLAHEVLPGDGAEVPEEKEAEQNAILAFLHELHDVLGAQNYVDSFEKFSSLMERIDEAQSDEAWHVTAEYVLQSMEDVGDFLDELFSGLKLFLEEKFVHMIDVASEIAEIE